MEQGISHECCVVCRCKCYLAVSPLTKLHVPVALVLRRGDAGRDGDGERQRRTNSSLHIFPRGLLCMGEPASRLGMPESP